MASSSTAGVRGRRNTLPKVDEWEDRSSPEADKVSCNYVVAGNPGSMRIPRRKRIAPFPSIYLRPEDESPTLSTSSRSIPSIHLRLEDGSPTFVYVFKRQTPNIYLRPQDKSSMFVCVRKISPQDLSMSTR